MRRAILATTLGALLLTGAACDSDAKKSTEAAPATPQATPSSAPTSPPPDYTVDTRKVCGKLETIYAKDLKAFGTEMGKMIAYKEAKAPAEANKSEKAAGTSLKTVAANIRKQTAAAQDPDLRTAGAASAAKLAKSATDAKLFDGVKTTKDLDRVIDARMGEWLSPVAGYCA